MYTALNAGRRGGGRRKRGGRVVLIFPLSQLWLHVAHLRLLFGVAQPNHPREKKQTSSEEAFSSFFFPLPSFASFICFV